MKKENPHKNTENRKTVEKKSHQGHQLTKETSESCSRAFTHWKQASFYVCSVFFLFPGLYEMFLHNIFFIL